MGAGTSPADPAPAGDRPVGGAESGDVEGGNTAARNGRSGDGAPGAAESGSAESGAAGSVSTGSGAAGPSAEPGAAESGSTGSGSTESGDGKSAVTDPGGAASTARKSRRFPLFTRDTARPEGGGRAASGDAPAPARQWPLLSVISAAGVGLLIVALDPFAEAFRIGIILIGAALIAGAVLRWVVPSVGMLAVRSRFTDLVTYGLMGTLIVLLALVAQPKPWLDVPILEDAVRFTIR
ncbi:MULTISPECIES: DUF3017 domain-containing protein [Streptomyces]|uniref:DUF3017 domain-containing protein n=2 Tax=Streptomyces TaxID=1883 RepID=A0A1E7LEL7_9ACTN|nr:DUF3017 domain-containing protein [Streptomyces nanshensis]OEV14662.1 hypothetical protein AN221_43250 [Streptomyces nanshensis]